MKQEIIIIAEIRNEKVSPVTYETAAFAQILAEKKSMSVKVVVINSSPYGYAEEIAENTGFDVVAVCIPDLDFYNGTLWKKAIQCVLQQNSNLLYICAGNTSQGIDYAPGLAVILNSTCITGVSGYCNENGSDIFKRSLFGGRIIADIETNSGPAILLIQPGIFRAIKKSGEKGTVSDIIMDEKVSGVKITDLIKPESDPAELDGAKTVIAVGRGVEEPENIKHVERFSQLFNNVAIGCSRPVVDMSWMKYKHQVGITGAIISPEIYIACGISGSSQHIAGMNGTEFVISVNSDPNAAIFNVSDICIVENMLDLINAFDEIVKK